MNRKSSSRQSLRVISDNPVAGGSRGANRLSFGGRSSLGGRSSIAGGRLSVAGSHAPSKLKRKSQDKKTTPSKRASGSHHGAYNQAGILKDPRPINSKLFKDRNIAELVEFLSSSGYSNQLSPKLLQAPPTRDFIKIFEFMFSFLHSSYKTTTKHEEEIPKIFKEELQYPFTISKASMYTVGSPHTWPHLLAALSWLREQIQHTQSTDVEKLLFPGYSSDDVFESQPDSKIIFDYVVECYKAFMSGDDTFEEQEEQLSQQLKKNGALEDMENLMKENERLRQELESVQAEKEASNQRLHDLKDELAAKTRDITGYDTYIDQMKSIVWRRNQQLAALETEHQTLNEELASLQKDLKHKQHILQTQKLSQEDIKRINLEREELTRQITAMERDLGNVKKMVWDKEMKVTSARNDLDTKCSEYNNIVEQLLLQLGKDPTNSALYMSPATIQNNVHINSTIKPALNTLLTQAKQQKNASEEAKFRATEELDQLCEKVQEQMKVLETMNVQKDRLDKDLKDHKELANRETEAIRNEIGQLEQQLRDEHMSSNARLHEVREKLQEEKLRHEKNEQERKKVEEELANSLTIKATEFLDHKATIQKMLDETFDKVMPTCQQEIERLKTELGKN